MGEQPKVYLTRKRRREGEIGRVLKQPNAEFGMKIIVIKHEELELELMHQNAELQTKLIDVNNDCLERVFMYLDFDDFINIAHTNKQLKPAADMAFSRKFAKKTVNLLIKPKTNFQYSMVDINKNRIRIYSFQRSLRFLRCFGHLVSKLAIATTAISHRQCNVVKLVYYINEYCSDSLIYIYFDDIPVGAFEELKKPFSIVGHIVLHNCTLEGKLAQLSKWFPALRILRLSQIRIQIDHIEANFSHLRSLTVNSKNIAAEHVMNILRLNPRLQYLYLNVNGWTRILQDASQSLLRLNSLCIEWCTKDFAGVDSHVFNFKHLNKLEMRFCGGWNEPVPKIPISFERLQEMTWQSRNRHHQDSVIEFFKKHSSITKLRLTHIFVDTRSSGDIFHIAKALPLLQEVDFERITLSVRQVVSFIKQAKLLKRMHFHMNYISKFKRMKVILASEWQASINHKRVELERRN